MRPLNADYNDGREGKGPALTVIGDSLSTGVIASSRLGFDLPRELVGGYSKFMFGQDRSLEATQATFSEYRRSAMTTDEAWGMRGLIATRHKLAVSEVPIFFSAQWGGRLMHVNKYLENLRILYRERKATPEYVLMMIGGNDFCRDFPANEFASNYDRALRAILALHPESQIFIGFIPPIYQALRYTHTYSPAFSCTKFRQMFCAPMLASDAYPRYQAYNNAIEAVAKKYDKIHPKGIHLIPGIRGLNLESADFAYDCFHPNERAHRKFAQEFAEGFSRSG